MAERGSVGATRTQLSREDGSERGPPRSWDNFSHWVCCVCVVTFDLELGQALEVCVISIIDETYFMMPSQAHTVKQSNFISQPDNNSYTCYMIGPLCPPFPPPLADGVARQLSAVRHGEE